MGFNIHQLEKLDDYRWLVPRKLKPGMLTDALIYADEKLLKGFIQDLSIDQAANVCGIHPVDIKLAIEYEKKLAA